MGINAGSGFTNALPPEKGIASVNSTQNESFIDVVGNKDGGDDDSA